jgi:tetratricopeptide (TPR) repeat protein
MLKAMTAADLIEQGRAQRNAGNLASAAGSYRHAVELLRAANQPLRLAHTIRHVGDILQDAAKLTEAEPCYEEALSIYRPHPDTRPLDLANAIAGHARLAEKLNRRQHAILLWKDAYDLYTSCGIEAGIEEAGSRLGDLWTRP